MTKRNEPAADESSEPRPKRPAPELPTAAGIWASVSNWLTLALTDTRTALFPPKDQGR